jgi:hypothetical protein
VIVDAEENNQLLFLAAAGMRTPETKWVFEGATEIELVIIQPPEIRRWTTDVKRVQAFERTLKRAVKISAQPDAKLSVGKQCRWCAAKPICPLMLGAVDRALKTQIEGLDAVMVGKYLANAELLEQWIKALRALAMQMMGAGVAVPDWKLVAIRGLRKWTSESEAVEFLRQTLPDDKVWKKELVSPAQAEKLLKPAKLPDDLIATVSSGTTFAPASDPRPEAVQIGKQLIKAMEKIGGAPIDQTTGWQMANRD